MKKLIPLLLLLIGCKEKKIEPTVSITMPNDNATLEYYTDAEDSLISNDWYRGFVKDTICIHDTIWKTKKVYLDTCVEMSHDDVITEIVPPGFARIPKDSLFDYEKIVDSLKKSKQTEPNHLNYY